MKTTAHLIIQLTQSNKGHPCKRSVGIAWCLSGFPPQGSFYYLIITHCSCTWVHAPFLQPRPWQ